MRTCLATVLLRPAQEASLHLTWRNLGELGGPVSSSSFYGDCFRGLSSWGEAAGPAWRRSSLSGNQARLCPSVMHSSTPQACLEGSSFALGRGLRGGWSGQNELGAAGSEQNPVSACPAGGTRRTSGGCVPGLVSRHQPRGLSPAGPGSGVEAEEWHPNKTGPTGWTDPQGLLATASPPPQGPPGVEQPSLSFPPAYHVGWSACIHSRSLTWQHLIHVRSSPTRTSGLKVSGRIFWISLLSSLETGCWDLT